VSDGPRKTDPLKPEVDRDERIEQLPRMRIADPPRPSHLQTREAEAYLQLIKDLNVVLAQEWQTQPETQIRRAISNAMADSLRIYI